MKNEASRNWFENRKSDERTETYQGSFWLIERSHVTEKEEKKRISIRSAEDKKLGPKNSPCFINIYKCHIPCSVTTSARTPYFSSYAAISICKPWSGFSLLKFF